MQFAFFCLYQLYKVSFLYIRQGRVVVCYVNFFFCSASLHCTSCKHSIAGGAVWMPLVAPYSTLWSISFYFSLTDSQAYISPLDVVSGMYMGGAEYTFYISCQVKRDSTILTPPFVFIRPPPFFTSGFYFPLFCFWPGQISYWNRDG